MIKRIKIENFRSFVKAEAELQPFTLVIGANGAGKSNLLRWFAEMAGNARYGQIVKQRHILYQSQSSIWEIKLDGGKTLTNTDDGTHPYSTDWNTFDFLPLFNLNPEAISQSELVIMAPRVKSDGAGTTQVLDSLKNGNREDLFDHVEENFRRFVPEVEKLSFFPSEDGMKGIQVRERGLGGKTLPASELSEGTRLILCILTIIHQENPPPVILLEDIDRGMHPRLFEQIAPLMRQIAREHDINIIATTHNPYLVDAFQDAKECVLLVEKVDGASVLVPLTEKLEGLDYDKEEAQVSLGELWYSGLVGGVPLRAKR